MLFVYIRVCCDCWTSIQAKRTPKFALANNMFRGPIPNELQDLSLSEEILISKYRTRIYMVKLVGENKQGDPSCRQTGYKGSIISFEQEAEKAIEKLPADLNVLVDHIAVLFVGTKRPHRAPGLKWIQTNILQYQVVDT